MGTLLLRLTIWLLLTANWGLGNVLLGVVLALLLPRSFGISPPLWKLLKSFLQVLMAIPQAYAEALEMIRFPHRREVIDRERGVWPPIPALVFLDIFRITFTPKTLVIREEERGYYQVHRLEKE